MGSSFSTPLPFEQRLRNALYNKDRELVATLFADPSFKTSQLPVEIYVEVAQRHWSWNIVHRLCPGATVINLVALLSAAVLASETYPYQTIFQFLEEAASNEKKTLEEVYNSTLLRHLFIVACHKLNDDMVDAFLDFGCFVPTDGAALRLLFRREVSKKTASSSRLIRRILCTHEGLHSVVDELKAACVEADLLDSHKDLIAALDEYKSGSFDKGDEGRLCGGPAYQRRVRTVVHSLKQSQKLSNDSLMTVASFIDK
jgi:hypothetical protein